VLRTEKTLATINHRKFRRIKQKSGHKSRFFRSQTPKSLSMAPSHNQNNSVVIRGADQKPVIISGYMDNAPAKKPRPNTTHHHGRSSTKNTTPDYVRMSVEMQRNARINAQKTILAQTLAVKELPHL
jgi:hypothetical protein